MLAKWPMSRNKMAKWPIIFQRTTIRAKQCLKKVRASMIELETFQLAKVCINTLEDRGLEVLQTADFAYVEAQLGQLGKSLLSPNFQHALNDFSDANAFWLILRLDADPIAVIGARLDRTGRLGLGPFLRNSLNRLYPLEDEVAILQQSEAFSMITGDVIYFGDLFIRPENRGSRPVLMCFVHLLQALAFTKWPTADWIYAFHRASDVLDGRADQYGFGNRWPRAQVWASPPGYRSSSEYLSTIYRKHFEIRAHDLSDDPSILVDWEDRSYGNSSESR